MKKILLIWVFAGLSCFNTIAQDVISTEQLPIYADLGGVVLTQDGQEVNVYPTQVTLEGQWCDVRLWSAPFSTIEYPEFKVVLQRGVPDAKVIQLFARNSWTSSNYLGPYVTFEPNQTVLSGFFSDVDTECYFDDDPICTWFAIQYMQKEKVTIYIKDVILIDEDGNEIHSHNIRNDSWKPSPDCINPDTVFKASVKFTSKGVVGPYSGVVEYEQAHRFTFTTKEPMPEGLTMYCVLDDGDDTTIDYKVPAGGTEFTTPLIDEDYVRVYIEYDGSFPQTVNFSGIKREIMPLTGVENVISDMKVKQRSYYSVGGMKKYYGGITVVRDVMEDGSVHSYKTIEK